MDSAAAGRVAVRKDFYSSNEILLHRAIAAAIGLQLHSMYRESLDALVPDRFNRLLRALDGNAPREVSRNLRLRD